MSRVSTFIVISMIVSCKKSDPPPTQMARPIIVTQVSTIPEGRSAIEYVALRRADYMRDLPIKDLMYNGEYTDEYFTQLQLRKVAVLEWVKQVKVNLVFIGQDHIDMSGNNTPDTLKKVETSQQWIFEELRTRTLATDIVTFEQYGSDERITVDEMVRLLEEEFIQFKKVRPGLGPIPPLSVIRSIVLKDTQAVARATHELPNMALYCGEEWPNALELNLIQIMNTLPQSRQDVTQNFLSAFNHLRSEIIVIRTLEIMKRTHGTRGLMIQGNFHAHDMPWISKEYGIPITVVLPP